MERSTGPSRRPVGRPPKISRETIAEAAHAVGLADLTLRAVADRLGVSVAGLYHHIDSKTDLLRLAAEHAAARVEVPSDHGQHWAVWLWEWAEYNRGVFLAEPELLGQYLEGAISPEVIAENTDAIIGNLVRQGFAASEAAAAYHLVSSCAIGSAVSAIREREAANDGRSTADEHRRILGEREPDDLPHLRQLLSSEPAAMHPPFAQEISTLLAGLSTERGERWPSVQQHLLRAGLLDRTS